MSAKYFFFFLCVCQSTFLCAARGKKGVQKIVCEREKMVIFENSKMVTDTQREKLTYVQKNLSLLAVIALGERFVIDPPKYARVADQLRLLF